MKEFATVFNADNELRICIDPDLVEASDKLYLTDKYMRKDDYYVALDKGYNGWKFIGWEISKPNDIHDSIYLDVRSVDYPSITQTIRLYDIEAVEPKIYKQDEKDNTEKVTLKSFAYNLIKEAIEKGDMTLADLWLEMKEIEEVIYMIMIDMMNKESE